VLKVKHGHVTRVEENRPAAFLEGETYGEHGPGFPGPCSGVICPLVLLINEPSNNLVKRRIIYFLINAKKEISYSNLRMCGRIQSVRCAVFLLSAIA